MPSNSPFVSTATCRLRPFSRFAASQPRGPPLSVVFTLWVSMMAAVGLASRPHLDGVDAPRRHRCAKVVVLNNQQGRRPWARLVLQPDFYISTSFPMAFPGPLLVPAAPARPGARSGMVRRSGPDQV